MSNVLVCKGAVQSAKITNVSPIFFLVEISFGVSDIILSQLVFSDSETNYSEQIHEKLTLPFS